jgi:hypothetical protein
MRQEMERLGKCRHEDINTNLFLIIIHLHTQGPSGTLSLEKIVASRILLLTEVSEKKVVLYN